MPAKKKPASPASPGSSAAPSGLWPVKLFTNFFAFIPGTHHMLTGHALSNEIIQWDLDTGEQVHLWRKGRKNKDGVNDIALDEEGQRFIAVDQSGMAGTTNFTRVWQLDKKKEPIVELIGHKGPVNHCAFLPASRVLTGGGDDTIRVWDLDEGGQQLHEMKHHDMAALVVAPDGKTALSASREIMRWNLETGEQIGSEVAAFDEVVAHMSLSPDHKTLACTTRDGSLILLAWDTCKEIGRVDAHKDGKPSVSWSQDGSLIVTANEYDDDECVRLWKSDLTPLHKVKLERPNCAAFGPEGIVYVALAYEGIVRYRVNAAASSTTLTPA